MIHTMLKLLGIKERIVFHTLEYHKKTDDIVDQPQKGTLSSICLPNIVNAHSWMSLSESPLEVEASCL